MQQIMDLLHKAQLLMLEANSEVWDEFATTTEELQYQALNQFEWENR